MEHQEFTPQIIEAIRGGQYTLLLVWRFELRDLPQRPTAADRSGIWPELVQDMHMEIAPDTPLAYVWTLRPVSLDQNYPSGKNSVYLDFAVAFQRRITNCCPPSPGNGFTPSISTTS